MTDFITMQNRIARELRHESSAFVSGIQTEIKENIRSAIQHYENDEYWFNQRRATRNSVAGQEWYAVPLDFIVFVNLSFTDNDIKTTLEPRSYDELEEMSNASLRARPQYYCLFDQQFRLYPIPDQSYVLTLAYTRKLWPIRDGVEVVGGTLSEDNDTNAWLTDAETLIRSKTKAYICNHVIDEPRLADKYMMDAELEKRNLQMKSARYLSSRQIRPQLF